MAKQVDHCTLIRSVTHTIAEHSQGTEYVLTGNPISAAVKYPSIGSIVSSQVASESGRKVPGYIDLSGFNNGDAGYLANVDPFIAAIDEHHAWEFARRPVDVSSLVEFWQANHRLNYDQLRPVLCFSLIWNLFETVACRRMASIRSIREAVDHADQAGRLDRSRYLEFVEFFRNRYIHNGEIEHAFDRLLMTNSESQVAVRRALVGEAQDLNNIVFALLLIAHRIRNNLFHGNKEIETLHSQTELFQVVNQLLATFIEDIQPGELHRRRVIPEDTRRLFPEDAL